MPIAMGLETEFGVFSTGQESECDLIAKIIKWISTKVGGRILGHQAWIPNGARIYMDHGTKLEVAGPECSTVAELVAWEHALDQLVEEAVRNLGLSVIICKNNTDHRRSYGSHENYSTELSSVAGPEAELFRQALIPFLVTRHLFAGAGLISSNSHGYELSQRSRFLRRVVGDDTIYDRAIVCTRFEPHSTSKGRLHLVLGDSLQMQLGSFLRFGTTALVILMLESDGMIIDVPRIYHPLAAFRACSADIFCKTRICPTHTAIEVQRVYLRAAERFLSTRLAPSWAAQVVEKWGTVLDGLATDPMGVPLDAFIKYQVLEADLASRGLNFDTVSIWHQLFFDLIVPRLRNEVQVDNVDRIKANVHAALPDTSFNEVDKFLKSRGIRWEELKEIWETMNAILRTEYGYSLIDRTSSLAVPFESQTNQIVDEEDITFARQHPPQTTRARLRGEAIRQHRSGDLWVSWDKLEWRPTAHEHLIMNLDDPLQITSEWR